MQKKHIKLGRILATMLEKSTGNTELCINEPLIRLNKNVY